METRVVAAYREIFIRTVRNPRAQNRRVARPIRAPPVFRREFETVLGTVVSSRSNVPFSFVSPRGADPSGIRPGRNKDRL